MKYTAEIVIDLPRERVLELFEDPDSLPKWQEGLRSMEHISGTPGEPGAKSRLIYDENGRTVEMTETILRRNLPEEIAMTYEVGPVYNKMVNTFHELPGGKTRWVTENEFKLKGLMALMALLMPGRFRRQTAENMASFKTFAEAQ